MLIFLFLEFVASLLSIIGTNEEAVMFVLSVKSVILVGI
jgi:hypothetical protein